MPYEAVVHGIRTREPFTEHPLAHPQHVEILRATGPSPEEARANASQILKRHFDTHYASAQEFAHSHKISVARQHRQPERALYQVSHPGAFKPLSFRTLPKAKAHADYLASQGQSGAHVALYVPERPARHGQVVYRAKPYRRKRR